MIDLPTDWVIRSVESICERVTSGGTPSRRNPDFYANGTIDWYKTGELKDRFLYGSEERITQEALGSSSAKVFPVNTVLMALYGDGDTITTLGLLKKAGATNQACCAMIVDSETADARYLFYALKFTRSDLLQRCVGGAQRNLSGKLVREHQIPIPPLDEQRAIAAVLGALDDKIEQNRRTGRALEALARAMFKAWFVDFEPVKAKAAGQTSFPGMPPAIFAALSSRFVNSAIGPVPAGWQVTNLKAVTTKIGSGATPRGGSAVYVEEGTALIRSQNVYDSEFRWEGLARLSEASADELASVRVEVRDVLINITGDSILRTCVIDPSVLPARVSQHVAIIRPISGLPHRYVHNYLLDPQTKATLMGMNAGGTRQAITKANLESLEFLLPHETVLEAFERLTENIFKLVNSQNIESRKLAALRDYLLPRLLSGRVRVRYACTSRRPW